MVSLRLGDVLAPLDTYASERGLSRADAARTLLSTALAEIVTD